MDIIEVLFTISLKHAELKAKELGVKILYLHTPDREQFYKLQGWEIIETPVYYDMQVTVMRKEINV